MKHLFLAALLSLASLSAQYSAADAAAQMRIRLYTHELKAKPDNARILVQRALAYSDNGQADLALEDLAAAERLGNTEQANFVQGVIAHRAGDLERAFGYFDRFLKQRPRHFKALEYRARLARDLGRNEQALADYQALLKASPALGPGYYIATARLIAELPEQGIDHALEVLDTRLAETGPVTTLQRYAIELEMQRENYDAALARMGQLPAALRATPEWQVQVAEILLAAHRAQEAGAYLEVALERLDSIRMTAARQRLRDHAEQMSSQLQSAAGSPVPADPAQP